MFSGGIGWHVQFGAGPGTTSWSNAKGKVCPGAGRIAQMDALIAAARTRPEATVIDLRARADPARAAEALARHRLPPRPPGPDRPAARPATPSVRPADPAPRVTPPLSEGRTDMIVLNVVGVKTRYCWEGPGRISAFRNPLEVEIAHLAGAPTRELSVAEARSIGVPLPAPAPLPVP